EQTAAVSHFPPRIHPFLPTFTTIRTGTASRATHLLLLLCFSFAASRLRARHICCLSRLIAPQPQPLPHPTPSPTRPLPTPATRRPFTKKPASYPGRAPPLHETTRFPPRPRAVP